MFLNSHTSPALRALKTTTSTALKFDTETNAMTAMAGMADLYFGGDMNAALALCGEVAGRIDSIRPVADILSETAEECVRILDELATRYVEG